MDPYLNGAKKTDGMWQICLLCSVINLLLFVCMSWSKHFTDNRCFHFACRDFAERGVTKSVGMCKCKPDACSPMWGDTQLRAGVLALNVYIYLPDVSSHEGPTGATWLWQLVRKDLHNIVPHVIPAGNEDITQKCSLKTPRTVLTTPAVMGKLLFRICSVWLMYKKLSIYRECTHG